MKKELFFDRHCGLQLTALTEDGKLVEFYTEREDRRGLIGDVYKGKVTNVLAGMNAVFVSCGLEKNCYLSTEETYTDYTKYDGTRVQTNEQPLRLEVGDEIMVPADLTPEEFEAYRLKVENALNAITVDKK